MPEMFLLDELRAYLIGQGVVQAQDAPASLTLASVWLDPRQGAPEPKDGENVTMTIIDTGLSLPRLVEQEERTVVEFIVRSRKKPANSMLHRVLRGLLHPIDQVGGRKLWLMNDLLVQRSSLAREEQPVTVPEGDVPCYTRTASYVFDVRRKSLLGAPYAD